MASKVNLEPLISFRKPGTHCSGHHHNSPGIDFNGILWKQALPNAFQFCGENAPILKIRLAFNALILKIRLAFNALIFKRGL